MWSFIFVFQNKGIITTPKETEEPKSLTRISRHFFRNRNIERVGIHVTWFWAGQLKTMKTTSINSKINPSSLSRRIAETYKHVQPCNIYWLTPMGRSREVLFLEGHCLAKCLFYSFSISILLYFTSTAGTLAVKKVSGVWSIYPSVCFIRVLSVLYMPVLKKVSLMILYFLHPIFLSLLLFISISMLFLEGHCCLPSGSRALVLILPTVQRRTQR